MSVVTLTHNEVLAAIREYVAGHYIHGPWLTATISDVTLIQGHTELTENVRADVVLLTPHSTDPEAKS